MDVLDETNEMYDRREGQRPVFITVLCILTWVGSFMGGIGGIFQLYAYSALRELNSQFSSNGFSDQNSSGYLFWIAIGIILGSLLCSLGAIFMFRLKKIGFFIYLVGQLIPLAGSVYSMLVVSAGVQMLQTFSVISTGVGMIFPIAFIIMYGVNLKHMNK